MTWKNRTYAIYKGDALEVSKGSGGRTLKYHGTLYKGYRLCWLKNNYYYTTSRLQKTLILDALYNYKIKFDIVKASSIHSLKRLIDKMIK